MSDVKLSNVIMYKSSMEIDNVAFDIIRENLPRDYFRIGDHGLCFLNEDHSTLKITGIDDYGA